MTDEDVIKRRLLIDGDGTGDDRKLNTLLKTFIKWCNNAENLENTIAGRDQILIKLSECEFAVSKSEFTTQMMKEEMKNYAKIQENIDIGIIKANELIAERKEELVLAKKIRKNRMEYDVLAKVISQQPDRKNTTKELELLKKELSDLEEKRRQLNRKLEVRKNDFFVLMRSLNELQKKLDDEKQLLDDIDNMSIDSPQYIPSPESIGE